MRVKLFAAVAALLVSVALSTTAQASLLVDWKPDPSSPNNYELSWTGAALVVTPLGPTIDGKAGGGAIGNGDGEIAVLNPALQTVGGLQIGTPLNVTGVPGSIINLGDGSTTFYDVTLKITNFAQNGPAQVTVIPGTGITTISQPIKAPQAAAATFELWSTPAPDVGQPNGVLLLKGTVADGVVIGLQGQTTASVQSTTVTYTAGVIYDKLVAAGGTPAGSLSFSLADINTLNGVGVDANVALLPFDANATGLFTAVTIPEPASLGLLALAALGLLRRNRK